MNNTEYYTKKAYIHIKITENLTKKSEFRLKFQGKSMKLYIMFVITFSWFHFNDFFAEIVDLLTFIKCLL